MRYEKALELLVFVLLAVGGAFVAVGVYESQSHRSAALWWALAVGAFAAAVLIPLAWLAIHPFFVWGRRRTSEWRAEAATPVSPASRHLRFPRLRNRDEPGVLYIEQASYASTTNPQQAEDFTSVVQDLRTDGGRRLSFTADNRTLGHDPASNQEKALTLTYRLNGKRHVLRVNEHDEVVLP